MAGRGRMPPPFARHLPGPGMGPDMYGPVRGPPVGRHPLDMLPPPEALEHKLATQTAEMQRLASENQRLAATHGALRQDLAMSQHELERLRAHIAALQNDREQQTRSLLNQIANMEADLRASESIKADLQQARSDAESFISVRQDLTVQVQQLTQELQRVRAESQQIPAMHAEIDGLRQELPRGRAAFDYEKDRLRYYFAVIECDSSATSSYLYKACDGVDFKRTSNVLDLRFIPDDMEFDHPLRDVATENPTNYLAPDYHTRALQHSKVNIAWDDDEPLRVKTLHRKFDPDQLNEMDFKAYLASDDEVSDGDNGSQKNGEDGEDGENKKKRVRENYRALLLESGDPSEGSEDKDGEDMEITFNTGLEDLIKRILEKSKKNNSEETVWEAYLRKRSEKKKAKEKLAERSSEDETSNPDGEYADDGERDNQSGDFFLDEESLDTGKKTGLTVNSSDMKKAVKKETKLKPPSTKMKNEENAGLFTVLTLSICAGVDCSPKAARAKVLKLSCGVNKKKKVKMKLMKNPAHNWFKVLHRWKLKKQDSDLVFR